MKTEEHSFIKNY